MRTMLLISAGWLAVAASANGQQEPEPLPANVVAAWKEAGAEVVWMGRHRRYGNLEMTHQYENLNGAMPGFYVPVWRPGMFARLPAPTKLFGLCLASAKLTDTDLKEVVAMQNLAALSSTETRWSSSLFRGVR